jgi:hypothetical protein
MPRRAARQPMLIDLDELLNGNPSWEQVVAFFKDGEFHEESYLVQAIERWLLTEEQRKRIFDAHLSIEKMLNGRYGEKEESAVEAIYNEWNAKLGHYQFGGWLGEKRGKPYIG